MKQQESQIQSLHAQLDLAIKTRDEMAQELFKLSTELEDHKSTATDREALVKEKAGVEERYPIVLVLY
jgi:hypothetical protein